MLFQPNVNIVKQQILTVSIAILICKKQSKAFACVLVVPSAMCTYLLSFIHTYNNTNKSEIIIVSRSRDQESFHIRNVFVIMHAYCIWFKIFI